MVRHQKDNAGPHCDGALNDFLNKEFQKRGWIIKFQPSNTPISNVKDDCIFPAVSKHVSREQGVSKGSRVFSPEELWAAVEKCWKAFPLETTARSCVRHHQIASAVASCNGGDEFVRAKSGLHCNVRNCCVTVCDDAGRPTGVEVVSSCMESEEEQPTLKHNPPELDDDELRANLARMSHAEVECMFKAMSAMSPLCEHVQDQFIANEMEAGLGELEEAEELNLSVVGV